jgi:hypothetical protein
MAKIIEVSGYLHPSLVWDGAFSADVEPSIPNIQTIQPIFHDVLGNGFITPEL